MGSSTLGTYQLPAFSLDRSLRIIYIYFLTLFFSMIVVMNPTPLIIITK